MNERLLHFIWQFQYFNLSQLTTTDGQSLQVISPGQYNVNQGPDFSNARIRMGTTTWVGTVEIHVRASDWLRHEHSADENYRNVILHVVWLDDLTAPGSVSLIPGWQIPTLELMGRVPGSLLNRYDQLINNTSYIACENLLTEIKPLIWRSWLDRLAAERLTRKAAHIQEYLRQNQQHWEETMWWLLARNFGMKVNAEAFEAIARSLPLTLLAKQRGQIHRLEALLFGQANLLRNQFQEDYPQMLKKEYQYLRERYGLRPVAHPVHFLRMRPVNFPTIRLAQLAALLRQSPQLFARIRDEGELRTIRDSFKVKANDYWHYHYRFDEPAGYTEKNVGDLMIDNLIINTVVPLLFTYGEYYNNEAARETALRWLKETFVEQNKIVACFAKLGMQASDAHDSQALVELKTRYCDVKLCLQCGIGNSLLNAKEKI